MIWSRSSFACSTSSRWPVRYSYRSFTRANSSIAPRFGVPRGRNLPPRLGDFLFAAGMDSMGSIFPPPPSTASARSCPTVFPRSGASSISARHFLSVRARGSRFEIRGYRGSSPARLFGCAALPAPFYFGELVQRLPFFLGLRREGVHCCSCAACCSAALRAPHCCFTALQFLRRGRRPSLPTGAQAFELFDGEQPVPLGVERPPAAREWH